MLHWQRHHVMDWFTCNRNKYCIHPVALLNPISIQDFYTVTRTVLICHINLGKWVQATLFRRTFALDNPHPSQTHTNYIFSWSNDLINLFSKYQTSMGAYLMNQTNYEKKTRDFKSNFLRKLHTGSLAHPHTTCEEHYLKKLIYDNIINKIKW